MWQGKAREALTAEFYPEFEHDFSRGFVFLTEYAHADFLREAKLFDQVVVRVGVISLSRTRIEFEFEYIREKDAGLLARGKQAVVWVKQQQRPSLMPDKLYNLTQEYFALSDSPTP